MLKILSLALLLVSVTGVENVERSSPPRYMMELFKDYTSEGGRGGEVRGVMSTSG